MASGQRGLDLLPAEFLKAEYLQTLPEAKQAEYAGALSPHHIRTHLLPSVASCTRMEQCRSSKASIVGYLAVPVWLVACQSWEVRSIATDV
jgi:hypothetical protein